MLCLVLSVVIAVLLTGMWLLDRAAKKKGHQMRDPGQMGRLAKDAKRDGRAAAAGLSGDTSWTTYQQMNKGHGERSIRENDELDDPELGKR